MAKPKRSPSARKALRQSRRRQLQNKSVRTRVKGAVKEARAALASGQREQATAAVKAAARMLDKAASKGVIHPRTGARYKSRLMSKAAAAPAAQG